MVNYNQVCFLCSLVLAVGCATSQFEIQTQNQTNKYCAFVYQNIINGMLYPTFKCWDNNHERVDFCSSVHCVCYNETPDAVGEYVFDTQPNRCICNCIYF